MLADESNPAPNTRLFRPVGATAIDFQLRDKGSSGEGESFSLLLGPLSIGLPEIGRTAPGARMQFTAGIEKCLQRIVLRGSKID